MPHLFNPSKLKCKSCGSIIQSEYSGHFKTCSCFKNIEGNTGCAIDSVAYKDKEGRVKYSERYIGSFDAYEVIPQEKVELGDTN